MSLRRVRRRRSEPVFARAQQMVTAGQDSAGRAVIDSVLAATREGTPRYAEALVLARDAQQDGRRRRAGLSADRRRVPALAASARSLFRLAQLEMTRGDRSRRASAPRAAPARASRQRNEHARECHARAARIRRWRRSSSACAAVAAARDGLTPPTSSCAISSTTIGPRCANSRAPASALTRRIRLRRQPAAARRHRDADGYGELGRPRRRRRVQRSGGCVRHARRGGRAREASVRSRVCGPRRRRPRTVSRSRWSVRDARASCGRALRQMAAAACAASSSRRSRGEPRSDAAHAAVPGDQVAASGRDPVLPDGRLLRDVLRRRRDRVARPRPHAHVAQQRRRGRSAARRRAGESGRRVPAPARAAGLSRRDLRAGRGSRSSRRGSCGARWSRRSRRAPRSPTTCSTARATTSSAPSHDGRRRRDRHRGGRRLHGRVPPDADEPRGDCDAAARALRAARDPGRRAASR